MIQCETDHLFSASPIQGHHSGSSIPLVQVLLLDALPDTTLPIHP